MAKRVFFDTVSVAVHDRYVELAMEEARPRQRQRAEPCGLRTGGGPPCCRGCELVPFVLGAESPGGIHSLKNKTPGWDIRGIINGLLHRFHTTVPTQSGDPIMTFFMFAYIGHGKRLG